MDGFASHEEVLVTLRQIIRRIDLHSRRLVQMHGLTGPQLIILKELGRAEEMPVGQLARLINLSHPTVTTILDRLEKRGLISRNRSAADKRRVMVSITEPGISVLGGAPSLVQEQFARRFDRLEKWEQTLILSSLQRVAAMMDAEGLDASSALIGEPLAASTQGAVEAMPIAPDVSRGRPGGGRGGRSVEEEAPPEAQEEETDVIEY
jgi:DNA-binding MarR family transcriptional regulator